MRVADVMEAPEDRTAMPAGAASELLPGAILCGRYKLQSELGRGGMGVVYRAHDLLLGRDVALKTIRRAESPTRQRRFLREAKLASRVHHPHAVFVVDFGELPHGSSFLVMELLVGRTLAAALRECHNMSALRVCRIGIMAASGMQSIHAQGIIHRDLKPANIFLLDQEGVDDFVKIVDFGVAKELEDAPAGDSTIDTPTPEDPSEGTAASDSRDAMDASGPSGPLTRAGALVGTPRYMAPEQLRGDPLDARVDQYALGCILYEMLTGTPPFSGNVQQTIRGHLYGELVPPLQHPSHPQSSRGLDAVILRAMARRREDRFPEMQALAAALGQEAAGFMRRPPEEAVMRWKGLAVASGLALLVAAGLGAAGLRLESRSEPVGRPVSTTRTESEAEAMAGTGLSAATSASPTEVQQTEASSASAESSAPQSGPISSSPAAAGTTRLSSSPSAVGSALDPGSALLAQATAALDRQDLGRAARLLESAGSRCLENPPKNSAAVARCSLAVPLYQGRVYEATGHWPEALSAYSRVLDFRSQVPRHEREAAWRSEAEVALARLLPRLGRVIIARWRAGSCEETEMVLPPGDHVLDLHGAKRSITLHARETLRLESCPPP